MSYVALRSMKIQKPDGTMELRKPGDPVPEADGWSDPERWVRRQWIAPADGQTLRPMKPPRKPSVPAKLPEPAVVEEAPAAPTHESLSKLTKVQLIQMGEKYGMELNDAALKEELIASVLNAARG